MTAKPCLEPHRPVLRADMALRGLPVRTGAGVSVKD